MDGRVDRSLNSQAKGRGFGTTFGPSLKACNGGGGAATIGGGAAAAGEGTTRRGGGTAAGGGEFEQLEE